MNRPGEIAFNDTGSGQPIAFSRWAAGERPRPSGRSPPGRAVPRRTPATLPSRRYMDTVFTWAGTHSLEREAHRRAAGRHRSRRSLHQRRLPRHAGVLVADVTKSAAGETRFLLLQSFMPAQQMHVLKNLQNAEESPWYPLDFGDRLLTPEWVFPRDSLRRWR
jgi:hypothetical protein